MNGLRPIATLGAIAAAQIACTTYGAREGPGEDAGAPDSTPASQDAAPETSATDSGDCDVVSPPGQFYEAKMDGACDGWSAQNGTITPIATPRRCGAGACQVCSSGPGESIAVRITTVARDGGTFELRFHLYGETAPTSWQAQINVEGSGGTIGMGGTSGSMIGGQWTAGQVVANYTGATKEVVTRISFDATAPNQCFDLDEIRLGHY